MKISILCLVVALMAVSIKADVLSDKVEEIKNDMKFRFTNMGTQLKEVGGALKDVAINKAKTLASQTLQALFGAVVNSIKGFSAGDILGKRGLDELAEKLRTLMRSTEQGLDDAFYKTFVRFEDVVERLLSGEFDLAEVKADLSSAAETHSLEVRGILSDTLNTGIDLVRVLYQKAKDGIAKFKDAFGKRGLLTDAANNLGEHLHKLHDTLAPHIEKVHAITTDIASALGHHAQNMMSEVGQNAADRLKGVFTTLSGHLETAKQSLKDFKNTLGQELMNAFAGF